MDLPDFEKVFCLKEGNQNPNPLYQNPENIHINNKDNEINRLKTELQKLKSQNEKLKSDLLKANEIISGIQNTQIDINEFKRLKDENMNLKYQLSMTNKQIQDLKLKLQNNNEIERPKYDKNEMMVVNFMSQDSSVFEGVLCLPSDVFVDVERDLYKKYDDLRKTNNMFTANAKPVLRFKTLVENGIKNGDKITLFKLE